ncbi:MAG: RagB/SusD family nutrient uptake outer membrane protein [Flavobacterium sp.]
MKRKIITAIMAFSIIATVSISCTDDYLPTSPDGFIGSENYFNSEEDYYKAMVGAYDILQSTYANVILGEIASDNTYAGGESATDVIGWQQVDNMTHTAVNSNLRDIWNWMFAGVYRTSYIMEFKDKIDFEGKDQIIAETRFLRAYYHFELVKWFGGIPLKGDVRFKLGDETTIPRSTKEQVYAAIEADLLLAIEDLNVTPPQVGRVSKAAAQALLGKVYLYWGSIDATKYPMAASMLQTVITTSGKTLTQGAAYASMFEESGENGVESLFEVQYTDVEGAGFGCLQCSEGNVAVGFSGPRNYAGPQFTSGFSFNVPTEDARDLFASDAMARRNLTLLDFETFGPANGATYSPGFEDTGIFNRKYVPRTRSGSAAGDLNLTNPNNYRAIRYADVLLMAAEAFNRISDDATARNYLNMVRERAFGNASQNATQTGSALLDEILDERRKELFGEGHRFFDLVRTNRAADAIDGFTEDKNEVFPIPLEEIQFSGGNWVQNQGYN